MACSKSPCTHEQFVHLFHAIGDDHHNRVVILTGSGDAFMDAISPEGFDFFSPQGYDKILQPRNHGEICRVARPAANSDLQGSLLC